MKMILVITIICIVSAFLLGVTYSVTIDKIKFQEELAERNALKTVLPNAVDFSKETPVYYKGFNSEGEIIGFAFLGEGRGYSSIIRVMVGVDTEGKVQGIKILSQKETPGLGAKIEEAWFQKQFSERDIDDIDTITGATISSNAVQKIVLEVAPQST